MRHYKVRWHSLLTTFSSLARRSDMEEQPPDPFAVAFVVVAGGLVLPLILLCSTVLIISWLVPKGEAI